MNESTPPSHPHTKTKDEILDLLATSPHGLSEGEVAKRLEKYGPNRIPEAKPESIFSIFFRQFKSPLIYMLLGAAAILLFLEEWADGGIIAFVLLFNAVIGTIQAGRAQNTLLALRKFVRTNATVMRDGQESVISDGDLVPGDIVILQEGEKVPADCRILESRSLRVDEAALTGESEPVGKSEDVLEGENLSASEKKNMLFRGTHVVGGNATAVVVATALHTEIGRISQEIGGIDTEIPLQRDVRELAKAIIYAVLCISLAVFLLGLFTGKEFEELLKLAVAIVVSAIPEGLPIVMTLLLATGVWRMSKRNVLVKRLQAVEALGETKVIAVDKTGTVTASRMVVQRVYADGQVFAVSGNGYDPEGEVRLEGSDKEIDMEKYPALLHAGEIAAFCANARLKKTDDWEIAGDPTEAAMLVFSTKLGLDRKSMMEQSPLAGEVPFDPKFKYHATLHETKDGKSMFVAGAPEELLKLSDFVFYKGKERRISPAEHETLEKIYLDMSAEGLRVIAVASKPHALNRFSEEDVKGLTLVGFLGMKDGLREGVHDAVETIRGAGVRLVMITGDHKVTAQAIAREAAIMDEGDGVLTGHEIEAMSDEELAKNVEGVSVFARVTPQQKLRLVQAYRSRGEIIAMTGDGVNDALSLVAADLGVAMGKRGTEVAKEASDLVLLDDNFGSIVSAIEEGRSIYKNLKKVLLFLLSTNVGEILVIILAILLGYPLPVLAAQLIWLNFVTDGFLVLALAMEPKEKGLLREKFKRPGKWIIDSYMAQRMFLMATAMMLGTLWLFAQYFEQDLTKAMTIALTTMAVYQWFKVWNCRSDSRSVFRTNPFENLYLIAAMIVVILLQLAALHMPFLQSILSTVPLSVAEWGIIIAVSFSTVIVDEIRKLIYRRYQMEHTVRARAKISLSPEGTAPNTCEVETKEV